MKLRRLHIEQFKCFRDPLTIDDFTDGLNLFAAPNAAGKSTVAEAIRAAFFERHRSSSVEHLRPWGDANATPTVEVAFEIDGRRHLLTKAFLGRKRCSLQIDGQAALDGAAAEDHLARLLGFEYPGRGASSAQHMGIPGLLWIRQGSAHELADSVGYAADHLRQVLGESLGELTSTGGDAVLGAVEAARNELLTPATGNPRGAFSTALQRKDDLTDRIAELSTQIAAYQGSVDRLAMLRRDHQRDERERPWAAIREQHQAALARLNAAQGLAARLATEQANLHQVSAQADSLRSQLDAYARDDQAVATRRQALDQAKTAEIAARDELTNSQARHQDTVAAEAAAREQLQRVRAATERAELAAATQEQAATLAALATTLSQAREARERLTRLSAEADAMQIAPADLAALKQVSEALREVSVRLEAVATTVDIDLLDGQSLRFGDEAVAGRIRRTVVAATRIEIEGVGHMTVTPGAADLDTLAAQRERLAAESAALLKRLGVGNIAEAEERARQASQRRQDAKASQQLLDALAPNGVDALDAERNTRSTRLDEQRRQLDALPPPADDDNDLPDLAIADAQAEQARAALTSTETAWNDARIAAAKAESDLAAAGQELAAAEATANDPQRGQRVSTAQQALTNALAQEAAARQRVDALGSELQSANLDLLRQDVERLDRSARQLEDSHARRQHEITRLEAELQTQGALGLEEQRAEQQRELESATRRVDELGRRAAALDHLLTLLRDKRAALARRLRAPLQQHLDRLLQILFPGARIEIADDLAPGPIIHPGPNGEERGEFEQLSMGTREQIGVIARLAYADLLQAAGKPTLLILDDALVNSDEDRLGQMKRVLYDAAQRHQVLIFTCHPAAWRDLGVPARTLHDDGRPMHLKQ